MWLHNETTSSADSAAGTNYNPKYSVRLSLTTASMFPNYQAPDSSPQPAQVAVMLCCLPAEYVYQRTSRSGPPTPISCQTPPLPRAPSGERPGGEIVPPLRDVFTVLALSFHAVFEGLAVGLEEVGSAVAGV